VYCNTVYILSQQDVYNDMSCSWFNDAAIETLNVRVWKLSCRLIWSQTRFSGVAEQSEWPGHVNCLTERSFNWVAGRVICWCCPWEKHSINQSINQHKRNCSLDITPPSENPFPPPHPPRIFPIFYTLWNVLLHVDFYRSLIFEVNYMFFAISRVLNVCMSETVKNTISGSAGQRNTRIHNNQCTQATNIDSTRQTA
jgi:hypothetical protein